MTTSDQPIRAQSEPSSKTQLVADSLAMGVVFALLLSIAQRGIGFVRSVVFCRVLPDDQLGQWSLTWSFLMLLAPLAVLGLPGSFGRFVEHYRQRGQLKSFIIRIALVSLPMTVAACVLLAANAGFFAKYLFRSAEEAPLVIAIGISLLAVAAFNFCTSLVEALRQVRLVTWMRFASAIVFAGASIGLALCWRTDATAVTYGFAVGCLVGTLPAVWFLVRNWNLIGEYSQPLGIGAMWVRIAPFALWLWAINFITNLYEIADRYMLLWLSPTSSSQAQASVGQYHSGRVVPLLLVGVATVLSGILMPYLTAAWESRDRQAVVRQLCWTVKLVAIGFTGLSVLALFASPLLFHVVLRGKYNDGLAILPLSLVYCVWYCLIILSWDYLWCREKGVWICLAVLLGLAANIGLNVVLIPHFGLFGAVWATAMANAGTLAAVLAINHRCGWRTNRRLWYACGLPMLLLLPAASAAVAMVAIGWGAIRYHWIFDSDEVAQLRQAGCALHQRSRRWLGDFPTRLNRSAN